MTEVGKVEGRLREVLKEHLGDDFDYAALAENAAAGANKDGGKSLKLPKGGLESLLSSDLFNSMGGMGSLAGLSFPGFDMGAYMHQITQASEQAILAGEGNTRAWHGHTTQAGFQASRGSVGKKQSGFINQGDYKGIPLGESRSTLSGSGCFLATLTNGHNALAKKNGRSGDQLDLIEANNRVISAGGFEGSALRDQTAAKALGMRAAGNTTRHRPDLLQSELFSMTKKLGTDEPSDYIMAIEVDYKANDPSKPKSKLSKETDHYICITHIEDGELVGIDSAGGREVRFAPGADGGYYCDKYRVTAARLFKADHSSTTAEIPASPGYV